MGNLTIDRFLMLYDLRYMKATSPMQMTLDPMFLRFVPTYSDRICVVSQVSCLYSITIIETFPWVDRTVPSDWARSAYPSFSQHLPSAHWRGRHYCFRYFAIAPSHGFWRFRRSVTFAVIFFIYKILLSGYIHVFGSENAVYNPYSRETEFAPPVRILTPVSDYAVHKFFLQIEPLHASIDINNLLAPYSLVPMQYPPANCKLLSDWPEDLCRKTYRYVLLID
jgi:PAB-dependent poly(A)-specific ribonuclease subunit 2